jgi:two-component system CheB/CheR fusion protein
MSKRALIVDDHEDTAELMELMLGRWGFDATRAGSVESAREKIAAQCPDVLLTDLRLPDGSGFDVFEAFRAACSAPVAIAITGSVESDDRERTTRAGFAAYLVKPVSMQTLREVLEKVG